MQVQRAFAACVCGDALMLVMPSNGTGWFWHALARETGRIGHLYSPGGERRPWPWFPYALDCGAFACWDAKANAFDDAKWAGVESRWQRMIVWAQIAEQKPLWVVVPDVPGNRERTLERWAQYAPTITTFKRAIAVQDGMTPADVRGLSVQPDVIAVGGSTEWKWGTVAQWVAEFPRVHVLRVNSPGRLYELEDMGAESCDGTGWNRGNREQTAGVEEWARSKAKPHTSPLWPHTCRQPQCKEQESFA